MRIIPSRLVSPTPASGVASIIRSAKDVNIDPSPSLAIVGEDVSLDKEVELDEGQYLVIRFQADPDPMCQHHRLLARADPGEFLPVVVGDSRVPTLYPDAMAYRRRLAKWRPGLKELARAEADVEYSFALRIAMEIATRPPLSSSQPQAPEEDDFA